MKTAREKNTFSCSLYLVSFTGVVYGLLKYFYLVDTPYGIRPHQYQSFWQHFHILASPIALFFIGYFWQSHIYPKMKTSLATYKKTGWLMVVCLFPMILSGFVIQISILPKARDIWMVVHLSSSTIFLLVFILHQIRARLSSISD
ncbi:MAG: hypothetical protein HN509_18080 [Halobacteriovoraceae bacterium]|nr:hypothetical protein [Halobacteriovoraceae bacterium]MBT5093423.1 hypothetical protein [Halobacteriovoraceae bacterium]